MKFSKKRMESLIKRAKYQKSRYEKGLLKKRSFDILFVLLISPFLIPLLLIISILIKVDSRGPIFYISKRVGLNGVEFKFYKFRTMNLNAEKLKSDLLVSNESENGITFKMKRDPRVTSIGYWLRKFSLDELPQFLNIIIGDMSIVGPRPAIKSEVQKYSLDDCKRLYFVPGLTCIWQVSGRSNIGFDQQVEMDLNYIKNYSILNDLVILARTVPAVLKGTGAY